jgi:hypothetical protein
MGELITVHEHYGNWSDKSKIGKLYRNGKLIVCEPYSFEGEETDENACHRSTDSNRQE